MTATQAPTPGPLSGDDVNLLVKGDLLRVIEAGSFLLGRGLVDGGVATVRSVDGPYVDVYGPAERSDNRASRFAFIGRPDADGWMPWSGGENPVPGRMVEVKIRWRGGVASEWPVESDVMRWKHRRGRDGGGDIIAFRLAPTAPVEASGSERENLKAALQRSKGWPHDLHPGPAADAAIAALRPQPSGETRDLLSQVVNLGHNTDEPTLRQMVEHYYRSHHMPDPMTWADRYVSSLLSARPLALGGQHSGGEVDRKWLIDIINEHSFASDAADMILERLSTTPARAEALKTAIVQPPTQLSWRRWRWRLTKPSC